MNLLTLPFFLLSYIIRWIFFLLLLPFRIIRRVFSKHSDTLHVLLQGPLTINKAKGLSAHFGPQGTPIVPLIEAMSVAYASNQIKRVVLDLSKDNLTRAEYEWLKGILLQVKERSTEQGGSLEIVLFLSDHKLQVYQLSEVAELIFMHPTAMLLPIPTQIDNFYYHDLLRRIGIDAQSIHIGDFKTAYNRFARRNSSFPEHVGMNHLVDGLNRHLEGSLNHRLVDTKKQLKELYQRGPVDARMAYLYGLVDRLVYNHELQSFFEDPSVYEISPFTPNPSKDDIKFRRDLPDLIEWNEKRIQIPKFRFNKKSRKKIAILSLSGTILPDNISPPRGQSSNITPEVVRQKLEEIQDRRFDGLLLKIQSPGGSAAASEEIWHSLSKMASQMPVVAYCHDVAASGGYYLACSAPFIYCHPTSIVGSIGVISAQISADTLLKRWSIAHETFGEKIETPLSIFQPLSEQATLMMQQGARDFYQVFLSRVGKARNLTKRSLHRYARGRVYLGREAKERELVDGTGGYLEALEKLLFLVYEGIETPYPKPQLVEFTNEENSWKDLLKGKALQAMVPPHHNLLENISSHLPFVKPLQNSILGSSLNASNLQSTVHLATILQKGGVLAYEPLNF